jgi:hypothetical protein
MRVENFIGLLSKAKQTGRNRWLACCPAHDDRSPSMTVSESDDGKILCHCFAGCSIEEICGSVGINLSDIMPERAPDAMAIPAKRLKHNPLDVLRAMEFNATVVAIAASDMAKGKTLTHEERMKLFEIAGAFAEAVELCQ